MLSVDVVVYVFILYIIQRGFHMTIIGGMSVCAACSNCVQR